MIRETGTSLTVMVVDESAQFTLTELADYCDVRVEEIIAMTEEGILEPSGRSPDEWRFPAGSIRRVTTVARLRQDLALNLPGAALAVDLLEELERLRGRVRILEKLLFEE